MFKVLILVCGLGIKGDVCGAIEHGPDMYTAYQCKAERLTIAQDLMRGLHFTKPLSIRYQVRCIKKPYTSINHETSNTYN
jgi:hypothetical protein